MRLHLALALLGASTIAAPVFGQGRAAPALRFGDMDLDRNRSISRAEWRGSEASFRTHDWNGDGVISGAELRPGRWRPARSGGPGDLVSPDVAYVFTDWTIAGFHRLDHNADGRIARDEWHFDGEAFNRADHNRDGALARGEFLGSTNPADDDDREDSFANLDADADGKVTRGEWHGGSARFSVLDQDGDGALTRDEAIGTHPTTPDLFTSVDINHDGALTPSEWHWNRASFDARDLDGDGRVTRDEAQAAGAVPLAHQQAHRDGYERGFEDGRRAGERDRERGATFDFENRADYVAADAGFQDTANAATRVAYQAGYRDGFRRGYREAYAPAWDLVHP